MPTSSTGESVCASATSYLERARAPRQQPVGLARQCGSLGQGPAWNQELQTVSGNVTTTAVHDARIHTVSGDIHLSAGADTRLLELGTVSGDLDVQAVG